MSDPVAVMTSEGLKFYSVEVAKSLPIGTQFYASTQPQPEPQEAADTVSIEEYRRVVARCIELGEKLTALSAPQEASKPALSVEEAHAQIRQAFEDDDEEASKAVPVADAQLLIDAALAIRALVNSNERWGLTMFRKNALAGANAVIERIEAAPASQQRALSDADSKDAARYRHLKDCNSSSLMVMQCVGTEPDDYLVLTGGHADEAIDAAILAAAGGAGNG